MERKFFIAVSVYIFLEKSQTSYLILYIKKVEKEQQNICKESRMKKIVKVRTEINKIESRSKKEKY